MPEDTGGTIAIDDDFATSGEVVALEIGDDALLDVVVDADAAATFELDVSRDGSTWFEGFNTYSSVTEVRDGGYQGFGFVRVKVASGGGTGGTGDEALIALASTSTEA